jgi:hypothetical protein
MANSSPTKIRLATSVVTSWVEVSKFPHNRFCMGKKVVDAVEIEFKLRDLVRMEGIKE